MYKKGERQQKHGKKVGRKLKQQSEGDHNRKKVIKKSEKWFRNSQR